MEAGVINYRGVDILISEDHDPLPPNDCDDDHLFLIYDHRDFTVLKSGFSPQETFNYLQSIDDGTNVDFQNLYADYHIFPVFAYIHSGVSLSLSGGGCRFDTSMRGFAFASKKEWTDKKVAEDIVKSLIETWNQYLSGECYGYEIEEYGDSCWGYYGEEALTEAKSIIDWHCKEKQKALLLM